MPQLFRDFSRFSELFDSPQLFRFSATFRATFPKICRNFWESFIIIKLFSLGVVSLAVCLIYKRGDLYSSSCDLLLQSRKEKTVWYVSLCAITGYSSYSLHVVLISSESFARSFKSRNRKKRDFYDSPRLFRVSAIFLTHRNFFDFLQFIATSNVFPGNVHFWGSNMTELSKKLVKICCPGEGDRKMEELSKKGLPKFRPGEGV